MVLIGVSGAHAAVRTQDVLTVGMIGAEAKFMFFDEVWNNLGKIAVFCQGNVTKDAPIFGDVVTIPWEVLQMPGVPVSIGVYGTSQDGKIVIPTVWTKTAPVQPGADPSGDESADPALPVWAQMQAQLNSMYKSSEEIEAAKEELLQAVEAGKEDIEATVAAGGYYTKAENNAKFAAAITGKLSGEIVSANDVSPVDHVLSVKARSKNLFNTTDDFAKTSATSYTYKDGVLNISGSYANKWIKLEEGKTYTFSAVSSRTGNTGGGIYIRMYAEDKVNYKLALYDMINLSPVCTFTTEKGYPWVRFTFYGSSQNNAEESAVYSNIQLVESAEAAEYMTYVEDLTASTVTRCSKNLIQYPFSYSNRTINGVGFSPKEGGILVVSGTATANTYFALNGGFSADAAEIPATLKPGEVYTIKDAMLFLYTAGGETTAFNEGTFTMPEGYDYYGIFAYVPSGTAMATLLMPQLELGGSATEFEPYTSKNYSVAADGTVEGVTSVAPGMTLLTDTAGVELLVQYNRDTNAVIADLMNRIYPAARITSVKLLASKWVGSGTLYSQVVEIDGVTENSQVNLTPSVEQLSIFYDKDLTFITENDGGVVTVYVIGQKPQNNYTIQADIVEVVR